MTKADFIKKYSQNYQLLKDKFVNKDKELASDLDSIIKDEIKKFSKHVESLSDKEINDMNHGDVKLLIKSYLNQKP